jgi:Tfp pilus assembly protein PilX
MAVGYLTEQNLQVSRGLIRGSEVRNIFGYQTAGDTTLRALWEFANTNYVFPTSAITMTVTSASASDDGKSLLIKGLDANYGEITDTVTINGGGDINTNITFFRINDIILTSGETNVGLITVQNTGKTVKYGGIRAGDGRNQASIFTVPADKSFFLYRIDAFSNDSTAAKPAIFRNFTVNASGQQYNTARTTFFNNMNIQRRIPFKYNEKTDIQFQCATNSGSHELSVFGEGILVDVPRTMYTGS